MLSKKIILFALFCFFFLCQTACAQPSPGSNQSAQTNQSENDWTIEKSDVPKGAVKSFRVQDNQYNRSRRIWVYMPAGYDAKSAEPYRLLISFDGDSYIDGIHAPVILNNLIAAGKIYPVIHIMVDNSEDRPGDLANRQKFADFIAKDLLPWTRENLHVTTDADKTTLLGYSAGGLTAAYINLKYPTLFGNVLSQSGAFWRGNEGTSTPSEWLTEQYKNSAKLNKRFYLEVGGGEIQKNAVGLTMLETSRHMRDVLKEKGYDVGYAEIPNAGHDYAHWRAALADGLIYLIGKK